MLVFISNEIKIRVNRFQEHPKNPNILLNYMSPIATQNVKESNGSKSIHRIPREQR